MLIIIAILIVSWAAFRLMAVKRNGGISFRQESILFLFFLYIIAVMSVTIIPLPITSFEKPSHGGINVVPLKNIVVGMNDLFFPQKTFETDNIGANLFGNILMFIPLGIFLPFFSSRFRSLRKVVLVAFIASAGIELTQLALRLIDFYRFVDIDDVILNTSGAALGFIAMDKLLSHRSKVRYFNYSKFG